MSTQESGTPAAALFAIIAALAVSASAVLKARGLEETAAALVIALVIGLANSLIAVFKALPKGWLRRGIVSVLPVLVLAPAIVVQAPGNHDDPVFSDDLSTGANEWRAISIGAGRYVEGRYEINLEATGDGGLAKCQPSDQATPTPSSLTSVRIDVNARRRSDNRSDAGFGVVCNSGLRTAYFLGIWHNRVGITKYPREAPFYVPLHHQERSEINPNADNHLRAECRDERDGRHLKLFINGTLVAEVFDRANPLPIGGVGVAVSTGKGTNHIRADFDNFRVRKI